MKMDEPCVIKKIVYRRCGLIVNQVQVGYAKVM